MVEESLIELTVISTIEEKGNRVILVLPYGWQQAC